MIPVMAVYAAGWPAAYVLSRRGRVRDSDGWGYPSWLTASMWPALAVIAAFIGVVLAYIWLDEALKREGV